MNDLRDKIARAISPDWWSDGIAVENREVKQEISLEQADAVLAVLADPPAEVVDRAAQRYVRSDFGCQCASCADTAKEHVLGVLAALVGGENGG